jgi:aminoglycoside phosphotransferase (APT) family kinase protein
VLDTSGSPTRVAAILTPPQLKRFREITGVTEALAEFETDFDGWSKLALLTKDRAFLFPRRGRDDALLFSADACEALLGLGVSCVPRVIGRWHDAALAVGPFVALERAAGTSWQTLLGEASLPDITRVMANLGRTVATWHGLPVESLPSALRRDAQLEPKETLRPLLDPSTAAQAVIEACAHAEGFDQATSKRAAAAMQELASMEPVLVHADMWEGQFFVDDNLEITTVIDWDPCGLAHPAHDFDLGEWDVALYEHEGHFPALRAAMWDGYAAALGRDDLPPASTVHLAFTIADLVRFERRSRDGTLDDWGARRLKACRDAIGPAIDAVV